MSGKGAPEPVVPDGRGLTLAIISTKWHAEVTNALLNGALRGARECGVEDPRVVHVPGAFELPVVAQALLRTHDAVVVVGLVLRGQTPHFEYVCDAVTAGCTRVALDAGKAVGFGVLMCDTEHQARDRAGFEGSREDKGREAVFAALETTLTLRALVAEPAR